MLCELFLPILRFFHVSATLWETDDFHIFPLNFEGDAKQISPSTELMDER